MNWRSDLLTLVEAYCASTGRSESRVASLVGGTGIFFRRIREGRDCSATVYQRGLQWFSDRWPEDLAWPDSVARPETRPLQLGARAARPVEATA